MNALQAQSPVALANRGNVRQILGHDPSIRNQPSRHHRAIVWPLSSDVINWESLRAFKLNEDDTTSSPSIFIKRVIERLATCVGMKNLTGRLRADEL